MKYISKLNKSAKEIKGLRTEIEILRRLNHENIIMLLDHFETDTDFVMVTEYGEVFYFLFYTISFFIFYIPREIYLKFLRMTKLYPKKKFKK